MDNLDFGKLIPIISRLSEDPEAMKAISGLMGAMNGQKSESPPPKSESQGDPLSSILSMMNGAKTEPKRETDSGGIFGSREEIKNRIMLLSAVKPYLSEGRREKLETVIKMLRLAEIGTLGSLLK
jgi:hypothetical protein